MQAEKPAAKGKGKAAAAKKDGGHTLHLSQMPLSLCSPFMHVL